MKRWHSFQDMPFGSAPVTFTPNAANVWSYYNIVRVNDLPDPSPQLSDPYVAGFETMQRLYSFYRPYKFKCRFLLDFTCANTAAQDFFHVFVVPTLGVTNPFTTMFTSATDVRYIVEAARKNPLITYKRIMVNLQTTRVRTVISGRTISLKSLIGVNPAYTLNGAGIPSDSYTSLTTVAPVAVVSYHLLVVREFTTTSPSSYSMVITRQFNTKSLFFGRKQIDMDSGEAQNV